MLVVTFVDFCLLYFILSIVVESGVLLQKNFKEINLKPWLHSLLLAGAYFSCVQVDFVNVHFVWKPRVGVVGVGKA